MKLYQLLEIVELDRTHFDTITDYEVEVVGIYKDIPSSEILDWPVSKLKSEYSKVVRMLHHIPDGKDYIEVNGQQFGKIPFTSITFGEYVDLEFYLTEGKLIPLLTTLYRRVYKEDPMLPPKFEAHGNYGEVREKYFLELDALSILGVKGEYIKWREKLHKSYSGLFSNLVDENEESSGSTISEKRALEEEKNKKAFVWEKIIMTLTQGDASRYKEIFNMSIIMVFNMLSYLKLNDS